MTRPLLTFDMDGVLCRPPFGFNPGSGEGKRRDSPGRKDALWFTERWRYLGRKPMPGALQGVRELEAHFDWMVVTARAEQARSLTESWFRRHLGRVPSVRMRQHWRNTSAQYKAAEVSALAPVAHFEDDPFTAAWLAEIGIPVMLVDWPRNAHLEAPGITRIENLGEAIEILRSRTPETS